MGCNYLLFSLVIDRRINAIIVGMTQHFVHGPFHNKMTGCVDLKSVIDEHFWHVNIVVIFANQRRIVDDLEWPTGWSYNFGSIENSIVWNTLSNRMTFDRLTKWTAFLNLK